MSFKIAFDYSLDATGFFDDPARRDALEAAGDAWEALIGDEFEDVPAGVVFDVADPSDRTRFETVALAEPIDDLRIYVGASDALGGAAGFGGPSSRNVSGDALSARISGDFRGQGPTPDFEPWAGSISFAPDRDWGTGIAAPEPGKLDLLSLAMHEIGHVLGLGASPTFDARVFGGTFAGTNAVIENGGAPPPLEPDDSHVEEGFDGDTVLMDPILTTGARVPPSALDLAMLADIGYEIDGFTPAGPGFPIATEAGETIFGRVVADAIDALGGDDLVLGDAGDDVLRGGAGDDELQGGEGADVLAGGPGEDRLFGQEGADVFGLAPGDGADSIQDFDLATERLRLTDSGFADAAEALAAVSKPFTNVSRLSLPDGTSVDVFHAAQAGTPLTAAHIELDESAPANAPPAAADDAATTDEDAAVVIDLLANDGDPDGDAPSLASLTDPARGAVADNGDGTVTYTPDPDFNGADGFSYTVSDGAGGEDSAEVAVTVAPVNDPPEGAVTVSGAPEVGAALSADASGLSDPDGLGPVAYEWRRDGAAIAGASGATYTVGAGDIGATLSVAVSWTDGDGTGETVLATAGAVSGGLPEIPGTAGDDALTGGAAAERLTGLAGADRLLGGGGDDLLEGGPGDDFLRGDAGADTLDGGPGNDAVFAGPTDDAGDVIRGGEGDDVLGGGPGDDEILGGPGADLAFGGDGDDVVSMAGTDASPNTVWAGDGDDAVEGGEGDDVLGGGVGSDDISAGGGNDTVYGGLGDGADTVDGGAGDDRVFTGAGDDEILGGDGDDILFNGPGADTVDGGAGADEIWGAPGDDILTGGAGADVFGFVAGNGADTITDFEDGTDVIRIEGAAAGFAELTVTPSGADTVVTFEDVSVTLQGVAPAAIEADDFVFA